MKILKKTPNVLTFLFPSMLGERSSSKQAPLEDFALGKLELPTSVLL